VSDEAAAVFLSYASEDAPAAEQICCALEAAGIEVWFDRSALRGGDAWDQMIRRQIKACALFVPIISAATHSRDEGYFRLEWKLAVDRSHLMAGDRAFLLPVVVDATSEADARVPDRFRDVQWTRLPGGGATAEFVARVRGLLTHAAPASARPLATEAVAATGQVRSRSRRLVAAGACVLAVVAAAAVLREPLLVHLGVRAPAEGGGSVAVLPFADMSEGHDQEYFSDGLAEELIDVLTHVPGLRVPARTSSFSFKGKAATIGEIAHALGVAHVLEGSVRKAGDRLRITAELVRADNGFHLWSQSYDRQASDVFAVQDDIARRVADELRVKLLGAQTIAVPATTSVEAHNLYLQARAVTLRDTAVELERAISLYEQALRLDTRYAPAWAWLAQAYSRSIAQGSDAGGMRYEKAITASQRAIDLDPGLAQGYLSLGTAQFMHGSYAESSATFGKARAIAPNDPQFLYLFAHLVVATGSLSEAIALFQRGIDGDPLNPVERRYLARALYFAGRNEEAVVLMRQTIVSSPDQPGVHYELSRSLLALGRADDALAAAQAEADPSWRMIVMPLALRAVHRDKEAREALAALTAHSAGVEFQVAEAYAYFGERDTAFAWLERARAEFDPGIEWTRSDPLFAGLVSDPRYAAYLTRIGQPPPRS
jgi:adenylate cyclase